VAPNDVADFLDASPWTLAINSSAFSLVSPGNSPGRLTVGGLDLHDYSAIIAELTGTAAATEYDQLRVNGTVSIGDCVLVPILGYEPATGQSFVIIDNDGDDDDVVGEFYGLPEGAALNIGGRRHFITYRGGDGNDVVLTRNHAPAGLDSLIALNEDSDFQCALPGSDPDGESVTFELVSSPSNAAPSAFALNSNGTVSYRAKENWWGSDSFTYRVLDGELHSATHTVTFDVLPVNDAPTVDAGNGQSVFEGTTVSFDGVGQDVDGDALTYTWDFGDGASAAGATVGHAYSDDGGFKATLIVLDSHGATASDSILIMATNAAPSANITGPSDIFLGDPGAFTLYATDPSPTDQAAGFLFHIDWDGDGDFDQTFTGSSGMTIEHVFPQAGTFNVRVAAEDKDGGQSLVTEHIVTVIQPVAIDIKPGDANVLNLNSNGVLAVAIFSTADFDASRVIADSVVFAGAHAAQSSLSDVNGDGRLDMLLHFRSQETQLRAIYEQLMAGDLDGDGVLDSNQQAVSVSLTGETIDEILIEGSDELTMFLAGRELREMLEDLARAGALA
jgi:hypothetical protein